jgi:hypothetical protein
MGDLEEPYRACLEVKGAAGTVAVVAVPVLIISLVVVLFLRWQFKVRRTAGGATGPARRNLAPEPR